MDLHDNPEQASFRAELRQWLADNLPAGWGKTVREPDDPEALVAFLKQWQLKLYEGGWAGLDWPSEYGGRGASVAESMIFGEEYALADAPNMINMSVGAALVGPTLIACGSDEQKRRFLEPVLKGEEIWCQGFSEPGAGRDLASLRTRADLEGDHFVVNGQKTWTSFAHHSQWCILVVRTDPESKRHRGLSFLLVDMNSPGITVRPLKEMTGHEWFNEVFFDQVSVPRENLVGELHQGWNVVMTTLAHERGSSSQHARLALQLDRLAQAAREPRADGSRAADDPLVRQRLADFAGRMMILRMSAWRHASTLDAGGVPGAEGSTLKILWSELDQEVKSAAIDLLGPRAMIPAGDPDAVDEGYWAYELLWSRAATIYAGTSEVQRNIIANRVLGLPRQ